MLLLLRVIKMLERAQWTLHRTILKCVDLVAAMSMSPVCIALTPKHALYYYPPASRTLYRNNASNYTFL